MVWLLGLDMMCWWHGWCWQNVLAQVSTRELQFTLSPLCTLQPDALPPAQYWGLQGLLRGDEKRKISVKHATHPAELLLGLQGLDQGRAEISWLEGHHPMPISQMMKENYMGFLLTHNVFQLKRPNVIRLLLKPL